MIDNVQSLFEHELRDLYDAENKLVGALERMSRKVTDPKLVSGFEEHREVTKKQVQRLEQVFELVGRQPRREACAGINGLIEEFSKFVEEDPSPEALDVFSVGAAKKVEQYEIVAYRSLIELAGKLGIKEGVTLLEESLAEEEETFEKLEEVSPEVGQKLSGGTIQLPSEERSR